ncbi:ydjO [Escherichia coli]|nr:ydjO [Escherichia coli]
MMSLWDALRMNMMISYQELVRTFPRDLQDLILPVIFFSNFQKF